MDIILRRETEKDYRAVEELTREAFWNIYVPGCSEHLILHRLRGAKAFVRELDYVAVQGGKIAGSIVYAETAVISPAGAAHKVLTFGPVSVAPELQGRGIGSALIKNTLRLARKTDWPAVVIYGDPEYYRRFGFRASKEFGITGKNGKFPAALLVLELRENAPANIAGFFDEGSAYDEAGEKELEEFDRQFPPKEKGYLKSQDRFRELSEMFLQGPPAPRTGAQTVTP
jgi:predicted N-acetyltransferase YhbS